MAVYKNPVAYTNRDLINNATKQIGQLFAPPKASDVYAYAKAGAEQREADRLADLYAKAGGADFNQDTFDRLGQAAGQWTPQQGYYGVDARQRTSQINNQLDNQTDLAKFYDAPQVVGKNETLYTTPNYQAVTGMAPSLAGMYSIGEDETAIMPGGETRTGLRSPMTESELKAAVLAGMDPVLQQAAAFGSTPTENVRVADGTTSIMTRPQALAAGPGAVSYRASLEGGSDATGLGPTKTNITDANKRDAELAGARVMLDQFEALLRDNPGVVGAAGKVRGLAQNAVQTVSELAQAFGGDNPELLALDADIKQGMQGIAPEYFDPNIPKAQKMLLDLAYVNARLSNPTGEVSRQALERSIESLGGGSLLSNNQSVLAAIRAMRDTMGASDVAVDRLRNPRAGGPQPGAVEDGYRFRGGDPADPNNWEPVQ